MDSDILDRLPEPSGNLPEVHAVFFDLDGTLIDSEVIYVDAVRLALFRKGVFISGQDSLALVYGRGWKDIFAEVKDRFPSAYASPGEMEEVVRKEFEDLRQERDIRIPGSIRLLKSLARSMPVAVVSGSPKQDVESGIQYAGVAEDLRFFMGAEDYFPGKPDPICYLTAAARLGVIPETCLVFEDSAAGVKAAKFAGMFCVVLQRDGAPKQEVDLADGIYADLGEFELNDFLARVRR